MTRIARMAIVVAVLVAACGGSSTSGTGSSGPLTADQLKGKKLYFGDYGGALTAADKKWFGDPFASKFGVNVQFVDSDDPPTNLHLQEQSGNVQYDIFAATYNNYKQGDVEIWPDWLQ